MLLNEGAAGPAAAIEALKGSGLPIALYGDGWYAPYVREYLARHGLKAAACFVDDGFTASAGTLSFNEVRERFDKFNIVIAFADFRLAEKKLAQKDLGQAAGLYFFDVMGALLGNTFDRAYAERHKEQFGLVSELLCDDLSKKTYTAFINAKLGDRDGLYDVWRKVQYFPEGIIKLSENEVFVDGGAYTGDTLLAFIRKTKHKYSRCYAFEPEPENAAKLRALAGRQGFRDVTIFGKGLWGKADKLRFAASQGTTGSAISGPGEMSIEVDTIDGLAPDATFIKLDVEGAELEALKGAAETIKRNQPKLAVCLYHKPGDLFDIPMFIKALVPEYRFYLRQHQPVACELVLYAVI
jgi:FkbM family methyltransferase